MVWVRRIRRSAPLLFALALGLPRPAHAERVVYLNLDPQAVNSNNGNDPSLNSYSSNSFVPGSLDGWPALDDADRQELLHWFKQATVPFGIRFVLERPMAGNYDMLVFGSDADNAAMFPDLGCSAAVGLADCDDADLENISFMFWGCMPDAQQSDLKRAAFYGLTGLGFGWGLENVGVSGEVMGSYTVTGLEFGNSCVALTTAPQCTHSGCTSGQQNSTTDLNGAIGPRVDDGPPVVSILSPTNYAIVDPEVTIDATVEDAFGGVAVTLEVVEAMQSLDDDVPPHSWHLQGVPEGMWTLRVTATDADANVTQQEVVVCVGLPECNDGSVTGGSSSSGGGSSSEGGAADSSSGGGGEESTTAAGSSSDGGGGETGIGTTATTAGGGGSGFGGGDAETGCGCSTPARGTAPLVWLFGFAAAWARRRRR
ncbi:MAG: hypothetical protein K1X88_24655 [Nannocystaceae bacterium]|nr:hypothetical protein [Nannocystaceae bacterium]